MMTQMPPPPGMPYQSPGQPMNLPAQTNVAAIISLICGILGCLGITALAAIVAGIIGIVQAKTLKTGKGMAIAGIVLALLWLGGEIGFAALVGYGVKHGGGALVNGIMGAGTKPQLTIVLDDLADGNTTGAHALMAGATTQQLDDLAAELKPMGHVKNIDFSSFNTDINNGKAAFTFAGTVTFDNGTKSIDGSAGNPTGAIVFDRIDLK